MMRMMTSLMLKLNLSYSDIMEMSFLEFRKFSDTLASLLSPDKGSSM